MTPNYQNYQKVPGRLERVSVVVVHRLSFVMSYQDKRMEEWKDKRMEMDLRTDDGNWERLGIMHQGSKCQGFQHLNVVGSKG